MHPTTSPRIMHYYRPQTKWRESNIFTCVCQSVHKAGMDPPPGTVPLLPLPRPYPKDHIPSGTQKQAVSILLKYFLVYFRGYLACCKMRIFQIAYFKMRFFQKYLIFSQITQIPPGSSGEKWYEHTLFACKCPYPKFLHPCHP